MKTYHWTLAAVLAASCVLTAPNVGTGQTFSSAWARIAVPPQADDGSQDFVFLAEARPVLIRVHARVNGKPVQAAWDDFMAHLFRYLDINGDGLLSEKELDRAPPLSEIIRGVGLGFYYGGGPGGSSGSLSMKELDTNKDGKVSVSELSAHYRKSGFVPIQVETEAQVNQGGMMIMGAFKKEPTIDVVSDAIFNLLDVNRDGKLSKDELAAASKALLALDTNEDQMVTTSELVPNYLPANGGNGMMMAFGSYPQKSLRPDNDLLIMVSQRGQMPGNLVNRIQERYSAAGKAKTGSVTVLGDLVESMLKSSGVAKKPTPSKERVSEVLLSRANLGLDEATFALLDKNRDGKLDARELAGFVNRTPDLEVIVRLGKPAAPEGRVQVLAQKGKPAPLAGNITMLNSLAMLDLGATRAELRGSDGSKSDGMDLGGVMRQQYTFLFKQADKDNNGYLDEKEAAGFFGQSFKAMDRDGDGKVTEQEMFAYLDTIQDLRVRSQQACVTLVLSDESRGLFDLLDVNRDGKLGLREMSGAVNLLEKYAPKRTGYLTRSDVPRSYRLTLRRGPAGNSNPNAGLAAIYGLTDPADTVDEPTAGPAWFRKMDRNRDGDVSRGEWLGSEDLFRRIDTDGDGLISVAEAVRYDAQIRKQK